MFIKGGPTRGRRHRGRLRQPPPSAERLHLSLTQHRHGSAGGKEGGAGDARALPGLGHPPVGPQAHTPSIQALHCA